MFPAHLICEFIEAVGAEREADSRIKSIAAKPAECRAVAGVAHGGDLRKSEAKESGCRL